MVNKKFFWIAAVMITAGFWIKGMAMMDPDFGLHMRMGEYNVLHGGVPMTDQLSYTMPDYPVIDHEWLSRNIWYFLYAKTGFAGMAFLYALMATGAIVLLIPAGAKAWSAGAMFLAAEVLMPRMGIRIQVETWLLMAIMLRIWRDRALWEKWRWVVPAGFALWVNLHGGFALGIFILTFLVGVRSLEKRNIDVRDVLVWGMSLVMTGLNPYGFRVWNEVYLSMTDNMLKGTIAEWQPFFVTVELGWVFLVAILGFLGWRYRKEIKLEEAGLWGGLWLAGLSSLRHMALFGVVAGGAVTKLWKRFGEEMIQRGGEIVREKVQIVNKVLIGIGMVLWLWQVGWSVAAMVGPGGYLSFYPVKAAEYLKMNLPEGNLFSTYGWGGYLVWKLPEKKLFIDGRMPSWRWTSPDERNLDRAFKNYYDIVEKGDYKEMFLKYDVTTVLWSEKKESAWLTKVRVWLKERGLRLNRAGEEDKLVKALETDGWRKTYFDGTAVIYEKPEK